MFAGCIFTCTFWAICPFTEDVASLPIAAWIPFKTDSSPSFELAFAYEIIATVIGGITDLNADCFMAGFIMVVCAQMKILNDSLLNLRHFAVEELNAETGGNNDDDGIAEELQKIMNRKLVECVHHHRYILEFAEEANSLFTTSILGQFAVSVIIICTTLFEMTLVPFASIKFISLILYQYCMLMEIFIVCYFGNEVILESSKLTKYAYHSDWRDCSQEFKRNLLFFMTRSQRALKLYAGGFFTLSLDTYVKILKSSWSYFVVLIQVNKDSG
uniref:Odorant receptor OR38 n=1 Tax=Colaphellus bowringi TaxID=561076 RepID=A0A0S3J2U6_9CUCU|nr:odorant receptor OR38 [Colaphellus bowringi]